MLCATSGQKSVGFPGAGVTGGLWTVYRSSGTELGPLEEQEALNLQALKFGLWRDGAFKRTESKEGNHANIRISETDEVQDNIWVKSQGVLDQCEVRHAKKGIWVWRGQKSPKILDSHSAFYAKKCGKLRWYVSNIARFNIN